jgi:hypothetical protein
MQAPVRCGAICLIALIAALSNQKRRASKQLAPQLSYTQSQSSLIESRLKKAAALICISSQSRGRHRGQEHGLEIVIATIKGHFRRTPTRNSCLFPQQINHEETKGTKEDQRSLVVGIATHDNAIAANNQVEQEADQDRADD